MIKKITFIIAFLLMTTSANAQFKRGSKEKIRALKIAYVTDKLDLSEAEAEKFWPIYNAYDKRISELRIESKFKLKGQIKEAGGIEALNETQAKEIALKMIALDKEMYKTTADFFEKLPKVLSYKKIIKLEIAEKDFHRKLLRKYRGKHKSKK